MTRYIRNVHCRLCDRVTRHLLECGRRVCLECAWTAVVGSHEIERRARPRLVFLRWQYREGLLTEWPDEARRLEVHHR